MAIALEEQDIDAELLAAQEEEDRRREEARRVLAQVEASAPLEAQFRAQARNVLAEAESQGAGIRDIQPEFMEPAPTTAAASSGELLPNYSAPPQPMPDKWAALQSFWNTKNLDTAAQGRQELALQGLDTVNPFENAPPDQPGPNTDTQARRLFGRNEFQRLVSAGVPPADAYARVAPDLLSGDTAAISRVLAPTGRRTAPVPPTGTASVRINRDPETNEIVSRSIVNANGTVQSNQWEKAPVQPKISEKNKAMATLLINDIKEIQSSATYDPSDPETVKKLESKRNELLELYPQEDAAPTTRSAQPSIPVPPFERKTFTETEPDGSFSMRQIPVARTSAAAPAAPTGGAPKNGDVRGGYKFNGKFPPGDRRAWDKQ